MLESNYYDMVDSDDDDVDNSKSALMNSKSGIGGISGLDDSN